MEIFLLTLICVVAAGIILFGGRLLLLAGNSLTQEKLLFWKLQSFKTNINNKILLLLMVLIFFEAVLFFAEINFIIQTSFYLLLLLTLFFIGRIFKLLVFDNRKQLGGIAPRRAIKLVFACLFLVGFGGFIGIIFIDSRKNTVFRMKKFPSILESQNSNSVDTSSNGTNSSDDSLHFKETKEYKFKVLACRGLREWFECYVRVESKVDIKTLRIDKKRTRALSKIDLKLFEAKEYRVEKDSPRLIDVIVRFESKTITKDIEEDVLPEIQFGFIIDKKNVIVTFNNVEMNKAFIHP